MREASWLESDLQFWTCPRKTRSTYGRNALGKYPQLASRQICLPVLRCGGNGLTLVFSEAYRVRNGKRWDRPQHSPPDYCTVLSNLLRSSPVMHGLLFTRHRGHCLFNKSCNLIRVRD